MTTVIHTNLIEFIHSVFIALGAHEKDARLAAQLLVEAELRGYSSHGLGRLGFYVTNIKNGTINLNAERKILDTGPATATVDADMGFGPSSGMAAIEVGVSKASKIGISAVGLINSYHLGRLADYCEQAARAGFVAMAFANCRGGAQLVAPFGGTKVRLSTNPIALAAPQPNGNPLSIDVATSVGSMGAVRLCEINGEQVPAGWLLDSEGNPTTDPKVMLKEPFGAMLPLGGESGHKGFALGMLSELLAGALTGGGTSSDENSSLKGNAALFILLDLARFTTPEQYQHSLITLIEYIKSTPAAKGISEVRIPGERGYKLREERIVNGIPLSDGVLVVMKKTAAEIGRPEIFEGLGISRVG